MGPEEEFELFDSENSWISVFQVRWVCGFERLPVNSSLGRLVIMTVCLIPNNNFDADVVTELTGYRFSAGIVQLNVDKLYISFRCEYLCFL